MAAENLSDILRGKILMTFVNGNVVYERWRSQDRRGAAPMTSIRVLLAISCASGLALLGACGKPAPQDAHPVADLLLINADVVTVDEALPHAQAVAIRGDRILAVGANDAMLKHRGDDTEVIDLQGQMAIPGFIEGHGHYTSFGGSLMILDFRYARSFAEIVSMAAAAAADTPAGEWIIGRGWH